MSDEWKILFALIVSAALLILAIVIADKIQVVRMANRGLCYAVVPMQNKTSENQWEKCK